MAMRGWTIAAVPIGLALTFIAGEGTARRTTPGPVRPAVQASAASLASRIDVALAATWAEKRVEPAPDVDDLTFMRRVWLDLLGTIPSLEEVRALEARPEAPGAARRAWLVDRALADPRSSAQIAERLARIAVGKGSKPDDLLYRRRRLVDWLSAQVARRRPWDAIVRDLITADGLSTATPATNFIISQDKDPMKLAARTARAFLGVRIDCAQCHDHPFADWKQTDFEGLAAFFARLEKDAAVVRDVPRGELELDLLSARGAVGAEAAVDSAAPAMAMGMAPAMAGADATEEEEAEEAAPGATEASPAKPEPKKKYRVVPRRGRRDAGPLAPPAGKRWVAPAAPFQAELLPAGFPGLPAAAAPPPAMNRRQALAAWVTDPRNDYFARALANRLWAWLVGRGLVEPLDELDTGAPWSRPLLDLLARAAIEERFDLEPLLRGVLLSRAYRVGSAVEGDEAAATAVAAAWTLEPLRADQLGAAVVQATSPWTWDGRRALLLRFARSVQLTEWADRHGGDPDAETAEDETLLQRLHLMNGKLLAERTKDDDIFAPTTRLPLLAPTDRDAVDAAFLMVLTRRPTDEEAAPWLARLAQTWPTNKARDQGRAAATSDLLWALCNTTEFAWCR